MSSSRDLANKADAAARPVAEVGMGKVRSWGHPLHPATGESLDPRLLLCSPLLEASDADELLDILRVAQSTTRSASSPSPSRSTPSRSPRPSPPASTTSSSSRPPQPSTSCRTTPAQRACSPPSRPSLRALLSCASCAPAGRFVCRSRTPGADLRSCRRLSSGRAGTPCGPGRPSPRAASSRSRTRRARRTSPVRRSPPQRIGELVRVLVRLR